MKVIRLLSLILVAFCLNVVTLDAQILDRAKRAAQQRKVQKENEAIDQGLDAVEGLFKKKKKTQDASSGKESDEAVTGVSGGGDAVYTAEMSKDKAIEVWTKRYDFKAGKEIIFFDDFEGEEVSEIPSKWAYQKGIMEVVEVNHEHGNVMMGDLGYGHPNWEEGFVLPEAYTIEFDVYMADPRLEDRGFGSYHYWLYLYDGNYRKKVGTIYLSPGIMPSTLLCKPSAPGER
ncbi:MAG: hypothetical protein AAFU03_18960, partial [Bacteroidota bacterium]